MPAGLPLAVPSVADVSSAVQYWINERAFRAWGLRDIDIAITSYSLSEHELMRLVGPVPGSVRISYVHPRDLLQPTRAPGRSSSDVGVFHHGEARVTCWHASDREVVGKRPRLGGRGSLPVRFELVGKRLPPIRSLEADEYFDGYRKGGYVMRNAAPDDIAVVRWPAGWTVLEAAIRDRGLRARPSAAGLAASALLRSINGFGGVRMLLSEPAVAVLHKLGETSGMSWFRRKVNELARSIAEHAGQSTPIEHQLEDLKVRLEQMTLLPSEEYRRHITVSDLVPEFQRRKAAAEAWLMWAEAQGLVVRGIVVRCRQCTAKSWRLLGELSPPLLCRGCARVIDQPFPAAAMNFHYRASELLTNALRNDSLGHVFALRYFVELFEPAADGQSLLYGGFPGVEILDSGGNVLGETDVLLLLDDGSLVPGEVKRSGAGLNEGELEKLNVLCDALDSPWSFVATLSRASDCPPLWAESAVELPSRPRFCLSAEHLFERHVVWLLDENPLAWKEWTDQEHQDRPKSTIERLPELARFLSVPSEPETWDWT
jgi:hypothetical protein